MLSIEPRYSYHWAISPAPRGLLLKPSGAVICGYQSSALNVNNFLNKVRHNRKSHKCSLWELVSWEDVPLFSMPWARFDLMAVYSCPLSLIKFFQRFRNVSYLEDCWLFPEAGGMALNSNWCLHEASHSLLRPEVVLYLVLVFWPFSFPCFEILGLIWCFLVSWFAFLIELRHPD